MHSLQISNNKGDEQAQAADRVRLSLLSPLKIVPTEAEKVIHLKLMKGVSLNADELEPATNWLNCILEANVKQRIYNPTFLWRFISELHKKSCSNIHFK